MKVTRATLSCVCACAGEAIRSLSTEPQHRREEEPANNIGTDGSVPVPADPDLGHSSTNAPGEGRQAGVSGPLARLSVRQHTVGQSEMQPHLEALRSAANHRISPRKRRRDPH